MMSQFDHVHVICKDLEKTCEFYKIYFGAQEIERFYAAEALTIKLDLSGTTIMLRGMRPGEREIYTTFGLSHFGIKTDDMKTLTEQMKKDGMTFIEEPWEIRPGAKIAFFRGPSGELIELLERKHPSTNDKNAK